MPPQFLRRFRSTCHHLGTNLSAPAAGLSAQGQADGDSQDGRASAVAASAVFVHSPDLGDLHARRLLPGDPPRVRKVPVQAAEAAATSAGGDAGDSQPATQGSGPADAAALFDLPALQREAALSLNKSPQWPTQRSREQMGGDMPYGRRPATGFALNDQQVASFCRDGYLVLRGVYAAANVEKLRKHTARALAKLSSPEAGVAAGVNFSYAAGPSQGARLGEGDAINPHCVAQVDDFYKMDSEIEAHMRCPKMTNALTELLVTDLMLHCLYPLVTAHSISLQCTAAKHLFLCTHESCNSDCRRAYPQGADIDAYQVTTITKSPGFEWQGGGYNFHQDVADYGGGGDCNGESSTYVCE